MKIYTKTGDKGTTSLISGRRISKADPRIDAYGTVDELNVHVGILRDEAANSERRDFLVHIQDRLFTMGSLLADDPEKPMENLPQLFEEDITALEKAIDDMNDELPPMTHFVLPGGHKAVSAAHLGRVVCRRAERRCLELHAMEPINPLVMQYLNRLSDYLFVLSRMLTFELGAEEIKWEPKR